MQLLSRGDRGFLIQFLQRLINKAAARDHGGAPILVDGKFGPQTDAAVRDFQSRHKPLVVDGIAGPQTLNALGLRIEKEHFIKLVGQPSGKTCWSAAATMILGDQSVWADGSIMEPSGGLRFSIQALDAFAKSLGWQMLHSSPSILELTGLAQRTSLWICESGSGWAHAVVISGVYSDGDASGTGTMFRIHDPWPPGNGHIYGTFTDPFTVLAADGKSRTPCTLYFIIVPA